MFITVLKQAKNMAELSAMGVYLLEGDDTSLRELVDPYQLLLDSLDNDIVAATLHRVDVPGDPNYHYHCIGVLDSNGLTYMVTDRQNKSCSSDPLDVPYMFGDVIDKASTKP